MTAPIWTGHLRRDAKGAITGSLRDEWGWVVTLTATPADGGGYTLRGEVQEAPPALRVPLLDGEAKTK